MARTWVSIRVDLVGGRGELVWPRPGRVMAAARSHTFAALANAIDDAFARWDRAHLHEFRLAGGQRVGLPDPDWDEPGEVLDMRRLTLGRLRAGERFVYVFDFGDDWAHLCTVGDRRVDPLEELGIVPDAPLPLWGWGDIPDQYGRRFDADDGESQYPRIRAAPTCHRDGRGSLDRLITLAPEPVGSAKRPRATGPMRTVLGQERAPVGRPGRREGRCATHL